MSHASGGRPKENQSQPVTGLSTLEDIGITRNDSSRWQNIAKVVDLNCWRQAHPRPLKGGAQ
jgi:hypothetical protein